MGQKQGQEPLRNPIDEILDDLTLDKVVKAAKGMTREERLERVRALREQRARWVAKGKV